MYQLLPLAKLPMNDAIRQRLCDLFAQHGRALVQDSRRCESLVRDFCGTSTREGKILLLTIKEQVPHDLLAQSASDPWPAVLGRLSQRLQQGLAMTPEAATWAIESWALALGVSSVADAAGIQGPTAASHSAAVPQRVMDANARRMILIVTTGAIAILGVGLVIWAVTPTSTSWADRRSTPASTPSTKLERHIVRAAEAGEWQGKECTIELVVAHTNRNQAFAYLNSTSDFKDEKHFQVTIDKATQERFKAAGVPDVETRFRGKTVLVTGKVTKANLIGYEVRVSDPKQIALK